MVSEDKIEQWKATKVIGIIGLGDMGLLYANKFTDAGWSVICCDREEYYDELKEKYVSAKFELVKNGHLVSRQSDYIIYSVEASNISKIVAMYGPSSKVGTIVGGQTSCKRRKSRLSKSIYPRTATSLPCIPFMGLKLILKANH